MCPMKIFKRVIKVIDAVEREFVIIDIDDYNDYVFDQYKIYQITNNERKGRRGRKKAY